MELKDLPPRQDPKGGSPKTPSGGIPVSQFAEETGWHSPSSNGRSAVIIGCLATALIGMTVAWWTAVQGHGVSSQEMTQAIRQSQNDQDDKIKIEMKSLIEEIPKGMTRSEVEEYDQKYVIPNLNEKISREDQQIGSLQTKIELNANLLKEQGKR